MDEARPDWRFCADPRHTVVFYMGLGHLTKIVAELRAAGATEGHPAAVIAQVTLPEQQIIRGTLSDIVARVRALEITPPALLIVGNVAAFAADLPANGAADFTVAGAAPVAAGALA